MITSRFTPVDPSEVRVLTFDFTDGLAEGETVFSADVEITVEQGVDTLASTRFGNPDIQTPLVLIVVSGQIDGVDYHVKTIATTTNSNKILVLAKILPVRAK
jgi:hypothetical protein